MANTFTASRGGPVVMGNKRVVVGLLTMTDGVGGGAVDTGLNWVDTVMMTPSTANTNVGGMLKNTAASGAGDVVCGSCTTADTCHLLIVGT